MDSKGRNLVGRRYWVGAHCLISSDCKFLSVTNWYNLTQQRAVFNFCSHIRIVYQCATIPDNQVIEAKSTIHYCTERIHRSDTAGRVSCLSALEIPNTKQSISPSSFTVCQTPRLVDIIRCYSCIFSMLMSGRALYRNEKTIPPDSWQHERTVRSKTQ